MEHTGIDYEIKKIARSGCDEGMVRSSASGELPISESSRILNELNELRPLRSC